MSSLHVIMVSTTRSDGKSKKKQKEKEKRKTKTWDWLKQHKFQQKKISGFLPKTICL